MSPRKAKDTKQVSPRRRLASGDSKRITRSSSVGKSPSRRSSSVRSGDGLGSPFSEETFESSYGDSVPIGHQADDGGQPARTRRAYRTTSIEQLRKQDRRALSSDGKKKKHRGLRIIVAAVLAVVAVAAAVSVYCSPLFEIKNIDVQGADHLTMNDMQALIDVPQGATLLNVNGAAIEDSLKRDAWVDEVSVNRIFPNTLEIVIKERTLAAVVEVSSAEGASAIRWAIARDGIWLMPIPDPESDYGKTLNPTVYEDVDKVLTITGVGYGLVPEIGTRCADPNVNNALEIINGLTTDLADQIKTVSATDADSTLLILRDGVEISFGKAEDIRAKERICQEILEENEGNVVYINVRVADRPTWRSV